MDVELTRRKTMRAVGSLLVAGSVAGCGGTDGNGGARTIEMTDDFEFDPDSLSVDVGATVTWENVGTVAHTVTAYEDDIPEDADFFASGGFDDEDAARDGYPDDGAIAEGERFEHTFETAGTYEYFCVPHEGTGMTARITVRA